MAIIDIETKDLATIVAGLAREGVTFECRPQGRGLWTITLTGGF